MAHLKTISERHPIRFCCRAICNPGVSSQCISEVDQRFRILQAYAGAVSTPCMKRSRESTDNVQVYGEKGELEVTVGGSFLHMNYDDVTLRLHDHVKGEVEVVDWMPKNEELLKLPLPARNVGRLYDAYAEDGNDDYADWAQAVKRHELLEKIEESSRTGRRVSLE